MSIKGLTITQIIQKIIELDPSYKDMLNILYSRYTRKELLILLKRKRKELEVCKEQENMTVVMSENNSEN